MSLLTKVVLSFVVFVVALAGVNLVATSRIIDRRVRTEVETAEALFAKSVATRIAKNVRAKEKVPVTEIVLDEQGLRTEKIEYVLVFAKDGSVLAHTYLAPMPPLLRGLDNTFDASAKKATLLDKEGVYVWDVAVPVVEGIEQVGAVHVGLRGAYLDAIKHDIVRASLVASGIVVLVAFFVAVGVGILLVRPLERLTNEVEEISAGHWDHLRVLRAQVRGRDEVGVLGGAFSDMAASVLERTEAMRLVLDNVGDGLLTVGKDGVVSTEVSAEAQRWFGRPVPGMRAADYLFPDDPTSHARFELGFSELVADELPFELLADQALRRFVRDERVFELEYRQVFGETGALDRFLVIARDVTQRVQAEADRERSDEVHAVVGTMLRDRNGFRQFMHDVEDILRRLPAATELVVQKRDVHTLKGNLAIFGFRGVARACHRCEDDMAETGTFASPTHLEAIGKAWREALAELGAVVPLDDVANEVPLRQRDYERILRKIEERSAHEALLDVVKGWKLVPSTSLLQNLGKQAARLGQGLGREIDVQTLDHDVRVDLDRTADFWSNLIHVVRNAVDHGLESPEERSAAGKTPRGKLCLATYSERGGLVVVVSDDGRGIDWERVRAKAGLGPDADRARLLDVLFSDGFSTRDEVSETSGRGVGLGALRAACHARGVTIDVRSTVGKGTTFTFRFPADRREAPVHVFSTSVAPPRPAVRTA